MGCCSSKTQRQHATDPIQARLPPGDNVKGDGSPVPPEKRPEEHTKLIEPIPVPEQSPKQSPKQNGVPLNKETSVASQRESVHRIPSPIKPVPLNSCCYMFGIDADNTKKIFKFDPKSESFSPIVIPANLEVYNMSACVYVSETCVYITGGIDPHTGKISNRAFLYNPERNVAEELPPFTVERYTHCALVFKDQLYILGGLGTDKAEAEEQENVLRSVEKYDIKTRTWTKCSDLYFGRSLATAIVYRDTLYALGGYIGETKRTRTIEKFNPQANQWEIIPFKLPRGLEAPYVFCPGPDQLQFIGGQDATGSVSINYIYNFLEDTYRPKKPMIHPRVLHKGFLYNEKIYVFGGDENDTMEEYHLEEDEWVKQPSALKSLANGIKLFSSSQPTLQVDHDPSQLVQQDASPDTLKTKKCFIFGDNDNSFVLEVNFTQGKVRERPIPTNLKLFAYQGAALLPDGSYLLCGGINKHTKTISTKAYIYNPKTNTAKKLSKCFDARYTFNLVTMDNYVYAIGGRSWEEDSEAILSNCERFSLAKNQWEKIAKLNHARCSAMSFRLKNKLYILGGYKGDSQRWANIEVYHPEMNLWEALKIELKVALEGSSLVMANQRGDVFLLGGRTDSGDTDKIWEFDVEQGDMWEVGNLKEAKSLSKVYEFQERKVLILGGEKVMAEFFDLREGKTIEGNTLVNDINNHLKTISNKGRNTDTKLWKFSLA